MLGKSLTSFFQIWTSNFPKIICLRDCPFPTVVYAPSLKFIWLCTWELTSGLSLLFHYSTSVFMSILHFFENYSFILCFKIRKYDASTFIFPFQECFGYPVWQPIEILRWTFLFLPKMSFRFCYGLLSICRSISFIDEETDKKGSLIDLANIPHLVGGRASLLPRWSCSSSPAWTTRCCCL